MQSRQLAAIMFTDIVGYTALMGKDEQKGYEFLNINRQIQKPIIEEYHGQWIKELGDGVMASFITVSDAVSAAIKIQRECNSLKLFQIRIGIHLCEVIFENDDVFGDGVNIASRLQAIANPSSIFITEAVYNNISNRTEFRTKYVGEQKLKNVKDPVKIYQVITEGDEQHLNIGESKKSTFRVLWIPMIFVALVLLGYFILMYYSDKEVLEMKSVAVLYFDNMSGDPEQEYLSDGITDEIISRLSNINGLRVPSRTSVKAFKGKGLSIKEIAQELGVDVVLEGSVKRSDNTLRITANLIDAKTDRSLWNEVYNREFDVKEILAIQSDISSTLAKKFELPLTQKINAKISRLPTTNTEAYDLYLKALGYTFISTGGDVSGLERIKRSELLLKKAIQLDPDFAEAYVELARIYRFYYFTTPVKEFLRDSVMDLLKESIVRNPDLVEGYVDLATNVTGYWVTPGFTKSSINSQVKRLLKKAYELDPVIGLLAFGNVYRNVGELPLANQFYDQVLGHNPKSGEAYLGKALIYAYLDKPDSAKKYLTIAKSIDPGNREILREEIQSLSLMISTSLLAGDTSGFERTVSKYYGEDIDSYHSRMGIYFLFGRDYKKAIKHYQLSRYRDMDVGLLLVKAGKKDSAAFYLNNALKERIALGTSGYLDLARIYSLLGNKVNAVSYFKQSCDLGLKETPWIRIDPFLDNVRSAPEFQKAYQGLVRKNDEMFLQIKENESKLFSLDLME